LQAFPLFIYPLHGLMNQKYVNIRIVGNYIPQFKDFVKPKIIFCQANLEMSYFRVLDFMGLPRSSLWTPELVSSPSRVIRWRKGRDSSAPNNHRSFFLFHGSLRDLSKPQGSILVRDPHRTFDPILDHDLRDPYPLLDLIELMVVGHRKVVPKRPFCPGRVRKILGEFWIVILILFQDLLLQGRKEERLKQA
jgi:hypothetical protein